jgi:hypothetical protein
MPAADFTNPDVFVSYLSSFWTQAFADAEAARGVAAGYSRQLVQLQQDFSELLRGASIAGMAPLHEEAAYPIFLRRSALSLGPNRLAYGAGEVYGAQPEGGEFLPGRIFTYGELERRAPAFYHAVDPALQGVAGVIVNRLFDPSALFVEGSDFSIQDGAIVFRENPFDNPLLPRRAVPSLDGTPDEEICLVALGARLDQGDLHRRYGYAFFSQPPLTGEPYRKLLDALMRLYSGGPTIAALDAFFAAACGVPLIREARETVETILRQEDGTQAVVTDQGIYPIAAGLTLRPGIVEGAVLGAGAPLTTATEVWDANTAPTRIFAEEGLCAAGDFLPAELRAGLGFANEDAPVESGEARETADGPRRAGRFALAGRSADVERFWELTRARSQEAGVYFADRLWRQRGAVDESGEPDYAQTVFINPLEFLFSNFLREGLIGVSLAIPPTPALLASMRHLRQTLPAARALLIFLRPGYADDCPLTVDPTLGEDPSSVAPVDERAILTGDFSGADASFDGPNPVASLVGFGQSPALLVDALDFGDPDVIQNTVRYTSTPHC